MNEQTENNALSPMDIYQILEHLPHRYPFLLIDKVIDYKVGDYLHGVKNITINEPCKPDNNSLYYFVGIDKARFKRPVEPGDVVHLHVKQTRKRRDIWFFDAEAKVEGKIVCAAELMCAHKDIV